MAFLDDVQGAGKRIISNSFYDVSSQLTTKQRIDYYISAGESEALQLQIIHQNKSNTNNH